MEASCMHSELALSAVALFFTLGTARYFISEPTAPGVVQTERDKGVCLFVLPSLKARLPPSYPIDVYLSRTLYTPFYFFAFFLPFLS